MKILPSTNLNLIQKKNTTFKSTFVPNKTLEKAFVKAEETSNKRFLLSVRKLLNDGKNRILELKEGIYASKDDKLYTLTSLIDSDGNKRKYVNFPYLFDKTSDSLIASDAILLVCEATKKHIYQREYAEITNEKCQADLLELKQQIFQNSNN